jgi:hypothetical protein
VFPADGIRSGDDQGTIRARRWGACDETVVHGGHATRPPRSARNSRSRPRPPAVSQAKSSLCWDSNFGLRAEGCGCICRARGPVLAARATRATRAARPFEMPSNRTPKPESRSPFKSFCLALNFSPVPRPHSTIRRVRDAAALPTASPSEEIK